MELNIDLETIEDREEQEFTPLAEGEYIVALIETDYVSNKAGNGKFLKCKFQILDGNSKGRLIWDNLNLEHPNETAVKIARQKLKELSHAVGVFKTLRDSAELHNTPLIIKLGFNKAKDGMEIKKYSNINEKSAIKAPKTTPAPVKEETQKKPWERPI